MRDASVLARNAVCIAQIFRLGSFPGTRRLHLRVQHLLCEGTALRRGDSGRIVLPPFKSVKRKFQIPISFLKKR